MFKNTHSVNPASSLNVLKTGGSVSLTQKISNMFRNMNWKTSIIYLLVAIILLLIVYFFIYKPLVSKKAAFTANRENASKDQNSNKTATLMLFYVDWCPHCKTAKPEWESLKSEYEGKNINGYTVVFVEHNCTNESAEVEQLMDKYKIEGYPTIKLIKDSQVIEYDAKPTKTTMEQFLNTVL
jgi:thiol-disulfide isomerase/thioredoxin